MRSLGITGSQLGSTKNQSITLMYLISQLMDSTKFYHGGDCIGVDAEFVEIVRHLVPHATIIGHPPDISTKRAFCKYNIERKPKPYLLRNKDIVNESDVLLVVPKEDTEQLRSGTWATYRYAKSLNKPIIFIYPNGKYKKEYI